MYIVLLYNGPGNLWGDKLFYKLKRTSCNRMCAMVLPIGSSREYLET